MRKLKNKKRVQCLNLIQAGVLKWKSMKKSQTISLFLKLQMMRRALKKHGNYRAVICTQKLHNGTADCFRNLVVDYSTAISVRPSISIPAKWSLIRFRRSTAASLSHLPFEQLMKNADQRMGWFSIATGAHNIPLLLSRSCSKHSMWSSPFLLPASRVTMRLWNPSSLLSNGRNYIEGTIIRWKNSKNASENT